MKYIGICGYANSGKDFLCEILSYKYSIFKISLADSLKFEVRKDFIEKYGIDPVNCSREQKDKIRPHLVSHAKYKRVNSNGTYFTKIVDSVIQSRKIEGLYDFIVIPDIRHAYYDQDEVQWLKAKDGILINCERQNVFAANHEEEIHQPLVKKASDLNIIWPEFKNNKIANGLDFLHNFGIIKFLDERLRTSRKS